MDEYQLEFGNFIHHDDGIFETVVNEGVELDDEKVEEFFKLLKSIEPHPSKILVNRINSYSYTFKANLKLALADIAKDIAVVKYGRLPWPLKGFFSPKFYHLAFFDDRNTALNWLRQKQES